MSESSIEKVVPGDVVQINEHHGRIGWIGCFVLVTEVHHWGIQGFVAAPAASHEAQGKYYIRLTWKEIDYVGKAALAPKEP